MPCVSEGPSHSEVLFDEMAELCSEVGIRPAVRYKQSWSEGNDLMAAKLCKWCQSHDVKAQSLELQIWWRDHQKWDAKRKADEEAATRQEAERKTAIGKLTNAERKALGV